MPMNPSAPSTEMVLWALDLDEQGNPIRAHRIVNREMGQANGYVWEETRITACGRRLNQHNHPTGWWQLAPGEVPLAEIRLIHCGLLMDPEEATHLVVPLLNPPVLGA